MANRVFISFRFDDGKSYKDELVRRFEKDSEVINCSEDKDRSEYTDETIKKYLYGKLSNTSVTIVILTPKAIKHQKDYFGRYDDWMYDEIRYSLEDRDYNKPNGLIAVYTPEVANQVITNSSCHNCSKECPILSVNWFDNLVRYNMMNVKSKYKFNPCEGIYNANLDSYCSIVSWDDFISDYTEYIKYADEKRKMIDHYDIKKDLNK